MNTDLIFLLEPASTLDTLEAVLATARRGGLELGGLHLHRQGTDNAVHLRLRADDPDLLDLFTLRMHNIIGVHRIERLAAAFPQWAAVTESCTAFDASS